jgi:myo-inositol-1(or 4)-monophosphatase
MAAGVLLIEEAGGRCSDMNGMPLRIDGPHVLADNGAIHDQALELFSEVFGGRYRVPLPQITV